MISVFFTEHKARTFWYSTTCHLSISCYTGRDDRTENKRKKGYIFSNNFSSYSNLKSCLGKFHFIKENCDKSAWKNEQISLKSVQKRAKKSFIFILIYWKRKEKKS